MKCAVTGGGGFVGSHLVKYLAGMDYDVKAVDIKYPEFESSAAREFVLGDLRNPIVCAEVVRDVDVVYHLAADMGGIGYITEKLADIAYNNLLIDLNMLNAATNAKIWRFFFSSSACVYPKGAQLDPGFPPLSEDMAIPAEPEPGYGWAKLMTEQLCQYFNKDYGLDVRVARFHNVFGPCFDAATEILTVDGWKPLPLISMKDSVATMNLKTGECEYQTPTAIQSYEYTGPMYRVKTRNTDLFVTPDHSLFYATSGSGHFSSFQLGSAKQSKWDRAKMYFSCGVVWPENADVPQDFVLPTVKMKDGRNMDVYGKQRGVPFDRWLEFVGWYVAEGSSWVSPTNYTVSITQKPGLCQNRIISCLNDLGFQPYVSGNNINVSSKQLFEAVFDFGHGAHNKCLPRWYLSLPPTKLKILFEALMLGDGNANGSRYNTVSRSLADTVQEIALKLGYGAWIGQEDGTFPIYRVHIRQKTRMQTKRRHRWIENYSGYVYDVTVPNHVILVRRDGRPVWSGNCGTYVGGKEKAPAALCRKVAEAPDGGTITVWGDGLQTRSFLYIDDCVEGIYRLVHSGHSEPLNLGSDRLISIADLAQMIIGISGKTLDLEFDLTKPQGVRGRNSDNDLMRQVLGWEPVTTLEDGLSETYFWIEQQVRRGRWMPTPTP